MGAVGPYLYSSRKKPYLPGDLPSTSRRTMASRRNPLVYPIEVQCQEGSSLAITTLPTGLGILLAAAIPLDPLLSDTWHKRNVLPDSDFRITGTLQRWIRVEFLGLCRSGILMQCPCPLRPGEVLERPACRLV